MALATMPTEPTTRTIDLNREIAPVFQPLLTDEHRFLVLWGGAGSGKSWFAAQKVLLRCMQEAGHRILVTRKTKVDVQRSVWSLLNDWIDRWGLRQYWAQHKTQHDLTYLPNGSQILCSGLDDFERIKSIHGITSMWHEEPTELMPADLTQLNLRLRGKTPGYKQHVLSFNPISVRHWLKERFFDKTDPKAVTIHTTAQDNPFIDAEYREELAALTGNAATVYAKGEWGTLEGAVYEAFIDCDPWPENTGDLVYGLDFGFNNPMALVEVGIRDGNEVFPTELTYQRGMTTRDLIQQMDALGISKSAPIYADSAEPDRIKELQDAGYNAHAAHKGPGSVKAGISFVQGLKVHTCQGNENLNAEVDSYVWRKDANDNPIDEPEDANNHLLDALRYALVSHLRRGRTTQKPQALDMSRFMR